MKNILKDLVHQIDTMNTISGGVAATTVKINREPDQVTININAPSMSSESFNIFLRGNQLVVYSVLNDTDIYDFSDAKSAARHMTPVFNQVFEIPPIVDRERIDAIYEKGMLKVIMPYNGDPSVIDVKRIEIREF
ncbi:MAG: Hsp20/alpha crystallin family protein [Cyclobacteriaceae bacterium]